MSLENEKVTTTTTMESSQDVSTSILPVENTNTKIGNTSTSMSKKRSSTRQLTKDDPEEEEEEEEEEDTYDPDDNSNRNSQGEAENPDRRLRQGFPRASAQVLQKRRIVKARRSLHTNPTESTDTPVTANRNTDQNIVTETASSSIPTSTNTNGNTTTITPNPVPPETKANNPFASFTFATSTSATATTTTNHPNTHTFSSVFSKIQASKEPPIVAASISHSSSTSTRTVSADSPTGTTINGTEEEKTRTFTNAPTETPTPTPTPVSDKNTSKTTTSPMPSFSGVMTHKPFSGFGTLTQTTTPTTTPSFGFHNPNLPSQSFGTGFHPTLFSTHSTSSTPFKSMFHSSQNQSTHTLTTPGNPSGMFRNVSSHMMIPKTQHLKYTNNTQEDENGEDPHAEDPTSYDPEEQDQEYAGDSDGRELSETVVGDLSSSTKVSNGEEDEVCIYQGRAKLFKMVESIIPTSSGMSMSTNKDTNIIDHTTTTNHNSPETLHLPPMTSSPHDTTRIFSIVSNPVPSSSAPSTSSNEETQTTSESKTVPSLPLDDDKRNRVNIWKGKKLVLDLYDCYKRLHYLS